MIEVQITAAADSMQTTQPTGFREALRSATRRYGIALLAVGVALGATLFLQNHFQYPFLFLFFGAVMVSAWFGGSVVGFTAVLLSTLAVAYFFVPPIHSFVINPTDEDYFASFVVCSIVAGLVSAFKRKTEIKLQESRDQLEIRVAERTAELQRSNLGLQESERRLRVLTEVIPQQIWSGTQDGTLDYCNQQFLDYAGCALERMRGDVFLMMIHPADRGHFQRSWQGAISAGKQLEGEWRWRGADGNFHWFFTRCVPLHDAEGKIVRWYATNTDVEDRHNAEEALLRTQSELARLSQSLSLGQLTVSIAHEVSQPLAALVTNGEACQEWLAAHPPNLEKARQSLQSVIRDGTRAGAIVSRIRALFQNQAPVKTVIDMREVIEELTVFFGEEAQRRGVALRCELEPNLPRTSGDRIQIQQVLLNLIINAMDAMTETPNEQKELLVRATQQGGTEILIRVEDTGCGFDGKTAEEIFKPFFTTKPRGTGMGLSISRSIVEAHEGRLWAAAKPSGGSVFGFTIPLRSETPDV